MKAEPTMLTIYKIINHADCNGPGLNKATRAIISSNELGDNSL